MYPVYLWAALAPLVGAIVAGFFGKIIGRTASHRVCIGAVGVSALLSLVAFNHIVLNGQPGFDGTIFRWATVGGLEMEVGFLVDSLTATMMVVVT